MNKNVAEVRTLQISRLICFEHNCRLRGTCMYYILYLFNYSRPICICNCNYIVLQCVSGPSLGFPLKKLIPNNIHPSIFSLYIDLRGINKRPGSGCICMARRAETYNTQGRIQFPLTGLRHWKINWQMLIMLNCIIMFKEYSKLYICNNLNWQILCSEEKIIGNVDDYFLKHCNDIHGVYPPKPMMPRLLHIPPISTTFINSPLFAQNL